MRFAAHLLRQSDLPVLGREKRRIAQLTRTCSFHHGSLFPPERWKDLQRFKPNVLVGSAAELHRLVERIDMGTVQLTTVDHAIFALTEIGDKPLTDVLRVVLWQRFGVPVYELYTDGSGALLAYECEAQTCWHVRAHARMSVCEGELLVHAGSQTLRTGLRRSIETSTCGCGRLGLRIVEEAAFLDESATPILAATA